MTLLFFEESIHGIEGGAGRLEIAIEVDPQDEPRVAFFESEVTGGGPVWCASGWSAITFASLLLALAPSSYRISFDIAAYIDEPSARALVATGIIACLLGDEIDSSMIMTGMLNPDGTIGSVGGIYFEGIYYKLQTAAESGLTDVLIPER